MIPLPPEPEPQLATLPNGVRVVTVPLALPTVSVSVFVRAGSLHETRLTSGIGHVLEHMVFKGTATRDAARINLDAERLGAEVNAHTDKDHTAFHMHGMARDAGAFVAMLGDLVRHATFPADELERERQVLLHEFTDDEDDPLSAAFRLFDKACYGAHPAAQPVIGTRRNIERFSREDLAGHVQRLYTGANVVVGIAGGIDPDALRRAAEAAFGDLPPGTPNRVEPPAYAGGIKTLRLTGSSQTHAVLGFPLPSLAADDAAGSVAAAVFGDGMSSPLLAELRERRALAYYTACSADLYDVFGQFVVEVSTAPKQLDELLTQVMRLLRAQAEDVSALDLERARNQIAVRRLRALERPYRRLEDAALDLFALGRLRPEGERLERLHAVSARQVSEAFERMLEAGVALALAGQVARAASERAREVLAFD
ncbi:MAG: insulinase family protein [Piscinibacter sp.]|nr:insulinase family protein [Piscinibacter sp.]